MITRTFTVVFDFLFLFYHSSNLQMSFFELTLTEALTPPLMEPPAQSNSPPNDNPRIRISSPWN